MKTTVLLILSSILSLLAHMPMQGQSRNYISLNENWLIGEAKSGFNAGNFVAFDFQNPGKDWFKTAMPKQVQDILFEKGLIPDPHVGKNPTKCSWIFEKDWIYATKFVI